MPVPEFLRLSISETLMTRIMRRYPFRGSQNRAPGSRVFFDFSLIWPDALLVEPPEKRAFSATALRKGRWALATLFPLHHGLLHLSVLKRMIGQNDQPATPAKDRGTLFQKQGQMLKFFVDGNP
jgi:hypothetical protein